MIKDLFKRKIEIYKSIEDLPLSRWFKINATNDLRFLMHDPAPITKKQEGVLQETWNSIFYEFLDAFGIPETMREILELKRDIEVLKLEMFMYNDRSLQTMIEIKQIMLENLLKDSEKEDTSLVKAHVEKYMGFKLPAETTVKEFYSYLHLIKEEVKRNKKALKNG